MNPTRDKLLGALSLAMSIVLAGSTSAQDQSNETKVVIDSRPSGAAVYLEGAYTVVGRTPLTLERSLIGPYKIRSWKYGFEEYSSELQFTGNNETILIRLQRKTPLKAGLRSFVFPGWGQLYTEQRLKALVISAGQLGTGIATLVAHSRYLSAKDDFNAALDEFDRRKQDFAQREVLAEEVRRREREMNDAYDLRRTWLWITGSVWAFNVLDAILFFPRDHSRFYDMRLAPISATIEPGAARVNLEVTF